MRCEIDNPLISVGITTFNRASYLEGAITSIIEQTYRNLEIIISVDASDCMEVKNVVTRYAIKDSRIKPHFHKERIGAGANIRFVLSEAKGVFFAWADEDDYRDALWFEKVLKLFNEPNVVVALGGIVSIDSANQIYRKYNSFQYSGGTSSRISRYFLDEEMNGKSNIVCGLFRTDFLKNIKHWSKYRFNRYGGGDLLFCLDCVQKGQILVDKEVSLYKRLPTYSDEFLKNGPKMFEKILRYLEYLLTSVILMDRMHNKFLLLSLVPIRIIRTFKFNAVVLIKAWTNRFC